MLTGRLIEGLTAAIAAKGGIPAELEPLVREYARAHREAGAPIEAVLVDVKALVRENTGTDDVLFVPRIVGWTIAGYFDGTKRDRP